MVLINSSDDITSDHHHSVWFARWRLHEQGKNSGGYVAGAVGTIRSTSA